MVLISRSIDKLRNIDENIKAKNKKIQTKIIQADLCKEARDIQMYERVAFEVSGLDVAILINNAGVLYNGYFRELSIECQKEEAVINTYPYVLMTRALLPILKKRKDNRSVIVNMASSASFFPEPYVAIYSATKCFDKFFSEALRYELSQSSNIEVLTVNPMFV